MNSANNSGKHPVIIQGGMGAGISWWYLARTVSKLGQLGVVSGTALDLILARRLQDGDPGGHIRRALDQFPFPYMADRIWSRYHVPGGKKPDQPYRQIPMHSLRPSRDLVELCVVSNFVEVFLAKENHNGLVGINYLEKIQMPHLPSAYGALLAGVSYVIMGAGIPTKIPGVLDALSRHEPASYPLHVVGAQEGDDTMLRFDPKKFAGDIAAAELPELTRPYFLPIISSNALADILLQKSNGRIDGFIIETPVAGGHNAPPRGKLKLDELGQPVYGERDVVDLARMKEIGLPFWVAGGYATRERLAEVQAAGAAGIQIGTAFAFCEESGMVREYREVLLRKAAEKTAKVYTDPIASPTGFPFKVAELEGTISEKDVYLGRNRICDLGYLRHAYRKEDGKFGYRCPSEPEEHYLRKGGKIEETVGRKCVCNGLMANIGQAQMRPDGNAEKPLITCGDDLVDLSRFLPPGKTSYHAEDVIKILLT